MDESASNAQQDIASTRRLNFQRWLAGHGARRPESSNTRTDKAGNRIPANPEPEDRSTLDDDADADIPQSDGGIEAQERSSMSVNLREIFQSLAQHQNCTCHLTQYPVWSEQAIDSTPGTPMLSTSDYCSGYSSFEASNRGSFFGTRSGNLSHSDSFSGTYSPLFFTPNRPGHLSKTPLWPSTPITCPDNLDLDVDFENYGVDHELPTLDEQGHHEENVSVDPSHTFPSLPISDDTKLGNTLIAPATSHRLREEIAFASDSNALDDGPNRQNSTCSKDQAGGGCTSGASLKTQVGSQRHPDSDGGNDKHEQPGNEVEHETHASKMIQNYLELAVSLKHAKDQLDEVELIYHTEISESSSTSSAQQQRERRIDYENQRALRSDRLDRTIKSVGEARLSCIMNVAFDPLREHVVHVTDQVEAGETAIEDEKLPIIREILKSFERDDKSSWLVTPLLSPSLLRDVRAWARLYGFGYKTLVYGSEEQCSVLIHKDREQLQPKAGDLDTKTRLPHQVTGRGYGMSQLDRIHSQPQTSTTKPWASCDNLITASFGTPQDDAVSCISRASVIPKKRRVPREDGAFNCLYPDCRKSFDRACDLAHHERIHCPKEDLPHGCRQCGKRFIWKKDLTRHERTHRPRG